MRIIHRDGGVCAPWRDDDAQAADDSPMNVDTGPANSANPADSDPTTSSADISGPAADTAAAQVGRVRVALTRTGGVLGVTIRRALDTADLPVPAADRLRALIASAIATPGRTLRRRAGNAARAGHQPRQGACWTRWGRSVLVRAGDRTSGPPHGTARGRAATIRDPPAAGPPAHGPHHPPDRPVTSPKHFMPRPRRRPGTPHHRNTGRPGRPGRKWFAKPVGFGHPEQADGHRESPAQSA